LGAGSPFLWIVIKREGTAMTFEGVAALLSLVAGGALTLLMFASIKGRLWAAVLVTGAGSALLIWLAAEIATGGV